MTQPAPTLSRVQKILAACGIFLFVGGVSWTYAVMKPFPGMPFQETIPTPEGGGFEGAPLEMNVPPTLNPAPTNTNVAPVMSGTVVPAVETPTSTTSITNTITNGNTNDIRTVPAAETSTQATAQPTTQPSQIPGLGIVTNSLAAQGFAWREDLGWDRTIFEKITPLANLVTMQSYLVLDNKGIGIGRVTYVKATDPAVTNVYDFLLVLARRDTSGKITISETTRGSTHIFLYNDLDKKENVRIVVQASAQEAFAIDLPAYLQGVADVALSQF